MILALDTETTGFDFEFGARPFYVTTCDDNDSQVTYRWVVNPDDRTVKVPPRDIGQLKRLINSADTLVLQNSKFDALSLRKVGVAFPWGKVEDTLIAGHVLASNQPHNLTDMGVHYLGINIESLEVKLKQACHEARRLARSKYPTWAIANNLREGMPSAGQEPWKMDMWLPAQIAKAEGYPETHPWYSVMEEYSDADSYVTRKLWPVMEAELKEKGLWKLYRESMRLPEIIFEMQVRGVTINKHRIAELTREFAEESTRLAQVCVGIAEDYGCALELPKSGNNKSLTTFVFDVLKLEPHKRSEKTGSPSLDKECLDHYLETLPEKSKPLTFIRCLTEKRSRDTAIGYMESYNKFGVPIPSLCVDGWYQIYPNLNQTGTGTTRSSSSNPNEQSVSKKKGFNLRYCFAPTPDREWFSADANNLEMVIPAFRAKEEALIHLFMRPEEPPYFGSYHFMIFDILHPKLFAKWGIKVKDEFKATWYKYVKNGNFAKLYGGQKNTVDRAYHVPGGYDLVDQRLPRIAALNQEMINMANKLGYVETVPDKSVDPTRGYPLWCARTEYSKVLPTVPLNYHVQGTGGWWKRRAMVRVHEFFKSLNTGSKFAGKTWKGGYYIIMDVHDELVFDCPKGKTIDYNYPIMSEVKRLMEIGGTDLDIPITVSVEQHQDSWSVGNPLAI